MINAINETYSCDTFKLTSDGSKVASEDAVILALELLATPALILATVAAFRGF